MVTLLLATAVAADPCVGHPEWSHADRRACASREAAALDSELAEQVAVVARNTKASGGLAARANRCNFGSDQGVTLGQYARLRHDLVEGQRSFIRYRDAHCRFEGITAFGGTAQGDVVTQCRIALTRERIRRLRALDVDPRHIDTSCVSKSKPSH